MGTGTFTSPTGGNKVHTYNLEIYFPDSGKNQNINQGKTFKAYIKVIEGDNKQEIPEYYVMATDDDFETYTIENMVYVPDEDDWYQDGYIDVHQYVGSADYVIIPEYIKGNLVTHTLNVRVNKLNEDKVK